MKKIKKFKNKIIPFILSFSFIFFISLDIHAADNFDGLHINEVLDGAAFFDVEPFNLNSFDDFKVYASPSSFVFKGTGEQTIIRISNAIIPKESLNYFCITSLKYNPSNNTLVRGDDDTLSGVEIYYSSAATGSSYVLRYNRGSSGFSYNGCRNTVIFEHGNTFDINGFDVVLYNDKYQLGNTNAITPIYILTVYSFPNNVTQSTLEEFKNSFEERFDELINGGSEVQDSISDFNQVFEDFNSSLNDVENFDNQVLDEFSSANDIYMSELNNFTMSDSLLSAANYLSDSMQLIYDNSGDYKMLWLVPMLFGIPILLFVVKRGKEHD